MPGVTGGRIPVSNEYVGKTKEDEKGEDEQERERGGGREGRERDQTHKTERQRDRQDRPHTENGNKDAVYRGDIIKQNQWLTGYF